MWGLTIGQLAAHLREETAEAAATGTSGPLSLEVDGQRVALDWTPQHFGGRRPWFRCPGCGRRCRILYVAPAAGPRLACRVCHDLRYYTQRTDRAQCLVERARKIVRRCGGDVGDVLAEDAIPGRSKGMHRRTFDRLVARYEATIEERCDVLNAKWAPRFVRMGLVTAADLARALTGADT